MARAAGQDGGVADAAELTTDTSLTAGAKTYQQTSMRLDPLIEDTLAALVATMVLGVGIAGAYWLLTGMSPWPFVVLGETGGLGFGVAMLALCSPRRRRP